VVYTYTSLVHTGFIVTLEYHLETTAINKNVLAESQPRTVSTFCYRLARVEQEPCSITENTVVDVGVFYDRTCVVPVTVNDEGDSEKY
jgi:hypothetical protein